MGNQLLKDYTMSEQPVASGGPHFLWKIYNGVNKTTREDVSVFICNIRDIEQKFGANNVETVLNRFRHEAQVLSKLRHPLVLHPLQPLFESKEQIAMVTEPVLGSLSNILLKQFDGVPNVTPAMKSFSILDVELKYGLCQIMEVLAFCHQNAKVIHANLNPQNIYLTPKGYWKISGFHFSICHPTTTGFTPIPKLINNNDFIPFLDYVAPEYVIESIVSNESDVFSFAMMYAQLLVAHYTNNTNSLLGTHQSRDTYITRMNSLSSILDQKLAFLQNETLAAGTIIESIRRATVKNHKERVTSQFILNNCELMFGEEVKALRFLSNMSMREPVKKATFLQTLLPMLKEKRLATHQQQQQQQTVDNSDDGSTSSTIDDSEYLLPLRIVLQRVLPPLLTECKDVKMCLFALPNLLALCTRISKAQFSQLVLPTLHKYCLVLPLPENSQKPISAAPQVSSKVPLIILKHLNILWSKTTESEQKNYIVPFLTQALNYHSNADIQMEAMKRSEEALNSQLIDVATFKTKFMPLIRDACERTNNEVVRTNAIVCVGKSLEKIDSTTIVNHVLPMVENGLVKNPRHASAPLLMSCVGVMRKISKLLMGGEPGYEGLPNNQFLIVMASRILPAVMPVSTQKSLNHSQFKKYMKAVRSMIDMIDAVRSLEFEELNKQNPLLSHNTMTHSDAFEDDDPTMADEMTEDPFQNSERQTSGVGARGMMRPPVSTTATYPQLPSQPQQPSSNPYRTPVTSTESSMSNAPPQQTAQSPLVQKTSPPQLQHQTLSSSSTPVAEHQSQQQQQPQRQQTEQATSYLSSTNANNPIHKLLTEAPGPTPQKKMPNIFFQGENDEDDEHEHLDTEEAEALRRDREMERLSMLIDRAERNHEFDSLLDKIDSAPDLAPLSTPNKDDFGYSFGEQQHSTTSGNNNNYNDSATNRILYPEQSNDAGTTTNTTSMQQQHMHAPSSSAPAAQVDHFDQLLMNQYGNDHHQASGVSTTDFWGTSTSSSAAPARKPSTPAAFDFDSLLTRHLSDDE